MPFEAVPDQCPNALAFASRDLACDLQFGAGRLIFAGRMPEQELGLVKARAIRCCEDISSIQAFEGRLHIRFSGELLWRQPWTVR